jgi:hypothetical protein
MSWLLLALASGAEAPSTRVSFSITAVAVERVVQEFEAICLAPAFDPAAISEAVRRSDLSYSEDAGLEGKRRWKSKYGQVEVIVPAEAAYIGYGQPQCSTFMASERKYSGAELLSLLEPAVRAHVDGPIKRHQADNSFYLEWKVGENLVSRAYLFDTDPTVDRVVHISVQTWSHAGEKYYGLTETLDRNSDAGAEPR